MPLPTTVNIDGREYIPKMPAANVAWTLGEYLTVLRNAAGYTTDYVATQCGISQLWLELAEDDDSTIPFLFEEAMKLARFYHADLELMALCYETNLAMEPRPRVVQLFTVPPMEPMPSGWGLIPMLVRNGEDDTDVAPAETGDAHDNDAAAAADYFAIADPGEPDDEQ